MGLNIAGRSALPTPAAPTRGRPRDPEIEGRVLVATLELIAEVGLSRTTIDAVAARSGVARATLYRRWLDRESLIEAAIRRAIGRPPIEMTGDLVADVRRGATQTRGIMSEDLFRVILPELVRELLQGDPASERLTYDGLFPARRRLAEEYRELAAAAGFRADADPFSAADLVVGAHLNHLLATGMAPSPELSAQLVDTVLSGLRQTPTE